MPISVAESSEGVILVATGLNSMLRWNGLTQQAEPAGIIAPTTAPALAGAGSGPITGAYVAFVRFLDADGNVSDLSPASSQVSINAAGQVNYTSVAVPTQAKAVRKQILRNTAGQLTTFFVDVDTSAVAVTSFSSTKTDAQLNSSTAVPLLDSTGNPVANTHAPPPNDKAFLASHISRMWAAGEVVYSEGSCAVTKNSATVTGAGTEWTAEMAVRFLYVDGATQAYEIESVDVGNQTLTLIDPYTDDTNLFAAYSIKPAPAQSSLVCYSEAGQPESWPATNALSLPEDSDVVTGLMPYQSFLYVLKRQHIYRISAQSDPAVDGFIFLSLGRGCVNHRCWVIAEDQAYLMDELGAYRFTGGNTAEVISTQIQDFFRRQASWINWQASRFFHASWSPMEETIRWFVALRSDYLPRHALCFAYKLNYWWIEEFPAPIGSSHLGRTGRLTGGWADAGPQVYYGGPAGDVYLANADTLDCVSSGGVTISGTVSAAGDDTLSDNRAVFDTSWANVPVVIVDGRGVGQRRNIVSATGTQLRVNEAWTIKPDTTSKYLVGGIRYRYRSDRYRYAPTEQKDGRSCELIYEPTQIEQIARLSLTQDFSASARKFGVELCAGNKPGVKTVVRGLTRNLDLSRQVGVDKWVFDGHREGNTDGPRLFSIGIDGAAGPERVAFGEMVLNGAVL